MDIQEVIRTRRSVRQFTETPVAHELIEQLLSAAVQAPSAMNTQPWAFGVIQGREKVRAYAERGRKLMLLELDRRCVTGEYRDRLADPTFDMFYNAPALVTIYATLNDSYSAINCSLAAENLLLTARDLGLGTCWIGFATPLMNDPAVKLELGVPESYLAITTIVIGHPAQEMDGMPREEPKVLYWL